MKHKVLLIYPSDMKCPTMGDQSYKMQFSNCDPLLVFTLIRRIRWLLLIFITGLVASGLTAFPLETELKMAYDFIPLHFGGSSLHIWIEQVYRAVHRTNVQYPFIAYGTDWLGFAHLVIAVVFIGPLKDPVKNIWVVEFGLIACLAILPFAFIAGAVREIPVFWRLFDCLFGIAGGVMLFFCYRDICKLHKLTRTQ